VETTLKNLCRFVAISSRWKVVERAAHSVDDGDAKTPPTRLGTRPACVGTVPAWRTVPYRDASARAEKLFVRIAQAKAQIEILPLGCQPPTLRAVIFDVWDLR